MARCERTFIYCHFDDLDLSETPSVTDLIRSSEFVPTRLMLTQVKATLRRIEYLEKAFL